MRQLSIYGTWGASAYYEGPDGIPRIVTSAGPLQTWQVATTPAPHWVAESTTTTIPKSIQDQGFFPIVSSDFLQPGSAIIWAVGRPVRARPLTLTLYAFSPTPVDGSLPLLYSGAAGVWSHPGSDANVTPLVANGRVYVAAYKTVTIFGPNGSAPAAAPAQSEAEAPPAPGVKRVTGVLTTNSGTTLTLVSRTGERAVVDAGPALQRHMASPLVLGQPYTVLATRSADDELLIASSILRAKPMQEAWPADR
jgi:hypothetical protein